MDEILTQKASGGANAREAFDKFGVTNEEYVKIYLKAKSLPPAQGDYLIKEYVDNLLLTVVDFMLQATVVVRAMQHFNKNARHHVRTHEDLKVVMARWPDTKEGNLELARFLWGYNLWTRAELLRRYVTFLDANGVTDQDSLKVWAAQSDFQRDFSGKVKGLGYAVYQWIIMRVGVDTFKPDVHVLRFVGTAIGRPLPENVVVEVLKLVAADLGLKAYELDWRIWEAGRAAITTPVQGAI